jgi:hypothetical protein
MHEYKHHHGPLPHPTVAQLLEADRPFHMAWAETCDKLWKADADLRRMQRVRQATAQMLQVFVKVVFSSNGSEGLWPQLVRCAPFPSIALVLQKH